MGLIHLVFGAQGAGKSTYSHNLAVKEKCVHLSIDEWMNELFGPDLPKSMDFKWVMERVQRCEKRIWSTAVKIVLSGGSVILDLGFMKIKNRSQFLALAEEQNFPIQMHYITAPYQVRFDRIVSRNLNQGATFSFKVTPAMFEYMEKEFEPATQEELKRAVIIESI